MDDSIDFGNIFVSCYLPLMWKDFVTHMHGLAIYVTEGLPFAPDLPLEKSADSLSCFRLVLLHSVSYFFFVLFFRPDAWFLIIFHLTIDKFRSINPAANVFFFGDFNVQHKDWLTYFGGTDRPGELYYNFSVSNDLTQMFTFLESLTVTFIVCSFGFILGSWSCQTCMC